MRVLIFGAGGMIGHKMLCRLHQAGHEVIGTIHRSRGHYSSWDIYSEIRLIEGLDVSDFSQVETALNECRPDIILNCIGITLRKPEISDYDYCQRINSDFPHFLQKWAQQAGAYLIHFSTDCVFSGKAGPYSENSIPDAVDTYGRTKAAGEVSGPSALTLRGSMIGRELHGKSELLEWALSQKNKAIRGYSRVIYSGVTTLVMAELVEEILRMHKKPTGLYQVSSEPISKYDLLVLINKVFKLNMTIEPDASYESEKVLLHAKISAHLGFVCPSWPEMIDHLMQDPFRY